MLVARPTVALYFFAFSLASSLCATIPFGKYILLPSGDRKPYAIESDSV